MKDYRNSILKTIYSLINGAIVVDGDVIETVSARPENDEYVHFYIEGDDDISTDDNEIRDLQVLFDCVSIQSLNLQDDTRVDKMINQLKSLVLDENVYSVNGWKVILTSDVGTETDMGETSDFTVFRRMFTMRIILSRN